ncbi:hypothetical protein EWS92_08130 [Vibrio vulnificus]|uniref:hypothetical protein n=1 Tax=Vibrio vulnificus TaxID=672 RepID=UPI000B4CA64E|nr:hypothetical protein [Vibrio vulnificus]EKA5636517.1 hypothetical protein [Vibrio navarrensis]ASC56516.1 hypothetical protein FORC37_0822 [Vibrio vulnificus]EGQ9326936.1 hypothetical protein [Vibrio vulnificus]EGR0788426.1 hypothetical protein [Vibrio vulnificus]EGR0796998.1 hypothetical protein [Vibrio vulnificus]
MATCQSPNADVIATRDLDLRTRVERLATLDDRKLAQMVRILLRKAVEDREEELGLPPIDEQAA